MELLVYVIIGLLSGLGLGFLTYRAVFNLEKKRAQIEASELIEQAKDQAEMIDMDLKEKLLEIEEELWGKAEQGLLKSEEKISEFEEMIEEKKTLNETEKKNLQKKLEPKAQELTLREKATASTQKIFDDKKDSVKSHHQEFAKALSQRTNKSFEEVKNSLIEEICEREKRYQAKWLSNFDIYLQDELEERAKDILSKALDRFARPFCAERGIPGVLFPTDQARHLFNDPKGENIKTVQEVCGCDILVEADNPMIHIAGFDPVRRELTRRSLEKILKEKKVINADIIRRKADEAKKELFRQIKLDGDQIAKELKLEGLHPEVRQMMGSLRYRYSFTQNQYFHCAEVGWLAGLLASELKIDIRKARRVGMLHDIGKSMDHAQDGGHAVIGANFIQARNESPEVVHAVRAHHYDEQPSTELAFLVIAADAISGARPGARRSTVETYSQKVTDLENIALGQEGVEDAFVLSGGREIRVFVDGKKVDDAKSLVIAREIATRIENEMNYPGQIKVVVVRSTIAFESTRV